jgi:hypothetical protein
MRRLLVTWAALGLLGAVGCCHDCGHLCGVCDCGDSWGCPHPMTGHSDYHPSPVHGGGPLPEMPRDKMPSAEVTPP